MICARPVGYAFYPVLIKPRFPRDFLPPYAHVGIVLQANVLFYAPLGLLAVERDRRRITCYRITCIYRLSEVSRLETVDEEAGKQRFNDATIKQNY